MTGLKLLLQLRRAEKLIWFPAGYPRRRVLAED